MADKHWTAWWRSANHPPPAAWSYTFEEFTNDETADEWALAAAIFVAQYRRRHSQGPTFRELFEHLLPDSDGVPCRLPADWDALDRRRGGNEFRRHVAIEWRRRGYIGYDRQVTRSLRVGPRFREQSRALSATSHGRDETRARLESVTKPVASTESLSADAARALLRISPTSLRRLSRRGYLHAVECGSAWRYPSWQFAGRPRFAVVPGINAVVPAIPRHWSPLAINSFMTAPRRELAAGETINSPVEWLMRGNDPQRVVDVLKMLEVSSEQRPSKP